MHCKPALFLTDKKACHNKCTLLKPAIRPKTKHFCLQKVIGPAHIVSGHKSKETRIHFMNTGYKNRAHAFPLLIVDFTRDRLQPQPTLAGATQASAAETRWCVNLSLKIKIAVLQYKSQVFIPFIYDVTFSAWEFVERRTVRLADRTCSGIFYW